MNIHSGPFHINSQQTSSFIMLDFARFYDSQIHLDQLKSNFLDELQI